MKNCRKGKAAIWTSSAIRKMRSRLFSTTQRAVFEISLFTGERMGAITQLKVLDVYDDYGKVLDTITAVACVQALCVYEDSYTKHALLLLDTLAKLLNMDRHKLAKCSFIQILKSF